MGFLLGERRESEKRRLEEKIRFDYLVCLKRESEYVKKLYDGIEISPSFLQNFQQFGEIKRVYKYIPAFSIRVDERIEEEFKKYTKNPEIEEMLDRVEKNFVVGIPDPIPSSISEKKLWNLEMVEAYKARKWSKGAGETVAVVDTGADYEHPEIEDNFDVEKGYNVLEDSDDPMDDHGHGTHCSGIIAGKEVGVAPGVTLKAVKFLNAFGWGTLEDAIKAIEWCIENNVDITSNSWGSSSYSRALEMIFDEAWERGILNVAAAGNSGRESPVYPAQYDSVLAVPAVDRNEKRAWFSTLSIKNEVSAPGVDIYSCIPGGKYAEWSGTSMACPHVSGGAAIVKAFYKTSGKRIRENLKRHAKRLGKEPYPNKEYGYGLLQIEKTLLYFDF
jgi:subtilisin family serine protease